MLYLRKEKTETKSVMFTKFIDTRLLRRCQGDARHAWWLGESDCSSRHTHTPVHGHERRKQDQ